MTTTDVARQSTYVEGGSAFFGRFGPAWSSVNFQVLKLETRQSYSQPGNESWEALVAGDVFRSLALIDKSVAMDRDLYRSLRDRGVDFVRVRPVVKPLSLYLKWELQHYQFNSREGERIYCVDHSLALLLLDQEGHHDFMVFDSSIALLHDYDDEGLIRGGWVTSDPIHIEYLIGLFSRLKASSRPFAYFLGE